MLLVWGLMLVSIYMIFLCECGLIDFEDYGIYKLDLCK